MKLTTLEAVRIVYQNGSDILKSSTMQEEKNYIQHGNINVYKHSLHVALTCVQIAKNHSINVDMNDLVRGALLHDYFLYDWHTKDKTHRLHGLFHAKKALDNANRDFKLTKKEQNMIRSHMFPLNLIIPRYKESIILTIADKICACQETFHN